jgi:hypothetical protein
MASLYKKTRTKVDPKTGRTTKVRWLMCGNRWAACRRVTPSGNHP